MICHSRASARIRLTIIGIAAAIASGLGPARSALGQDSSGIVIDADECVDLASADARLACYDRRAEAARQARQRATSPEAAADSSVSAAPEIRSAPTPPVATGAGAGDPEAATASQSSSRRGASDDGADGEALRASSNRADARSDESNARSARSAQDDAPSREDDRDEIVATIADLRETIPDTYLITLENGQVWRQVQPKRYPLRAGDEVRIYVSRWGSHRLESDGPQTFIQVERVR